MKLKVQVKRKYMLVDPPPPIKEKEIPRVSRRVKRYLATLIGVLSILALIIGLSCFFILNYGTGESRCKPAEFMCKSGDCINNRFLCDGMIDCLDNSDETNCTEKQLICGKQKKWTCDSGECINPDYVCDGDDDCDDNSDERNCKDCKLPSRSCDASNQNQCVHFCNGKVDCIDGSDEKNCTEKQLICGKQDLWACDSGKCIDPDYVCDGVDDCDDKSDERNCPG